MATFRITYRPGGRLLVEDLDADTYRVEAGSWHVLRGTAVVIGRPREVVVLRVSTRDAYVTPLCDGRCHDGRYASASRRPACDRP